MSKLSFKFWLLDEDSRSLAKVYAGLLKNVPQDKEHHPEGDVLTHVKLVRKAIPGAIRRLNVLKNTPPFSNILEDMDFSLTPKELQILYISAWLHDVGKATATTIGGVNYEFLRQMDIQYQNDASKIKSVGHDLPAHYSPLINRLGGFAPPETKALYEENKDVIDFIIDHHMQLGQFPKSFIREHFNNGKAINTQKLKLLLVLMWADKMGRTPESVNKAMSENERKLLDCSNESIKQKQNQEKTASRQKSFNDPVVMAKGLLQKGLSKESVLKSIKGKFPNITDEELSSILRST
jgi:arsenate reductase-like glutaredoxin family protein